METHLGSVYGIRFFSLFRENVDPFAYPAQKGNLALLGGYGRTWPEPELTAVCLRASLADPHLNHTVLFPGVDVPHVSILDPDSTRCGINMFKIEKFLEHQSLNHPHNHPVSSYDPHFSCIALTEGTGKTVEHESGYRITHGKILALLIQTSPLNWEERDTIVPLPESEHSLDELHEATNHYCRSRDMLFRGKYFPTRHIEFQKLDKELFEISHKVLNRITAPLTITEYLSQQFVKDNPSYSNVKMMHSMDEFINYAKEFTTSPTAQLEQTI